MMGEKGDWLEPALKVAYKKGEQFREEATTPDAVNENQIEAVQLAFLAGAMGWGWNAKRLKEIGEKPETPPPGGSF